MVTKSKMSDLLHKISMMLNDVVNKMRHFHVVCILLYNYGPTPYNSDLGMDPYGKVVLIGWTWRYCIFPKKI